MLSSQKPLENGSECIFGRERFIFVWRLNEYTRDLKESDRAHEKDPNVPPFLLNLSRPLRSRHGAYAESLASACLCVRSCVSMESKMCVRARGHVLADVAHEPVCMHAQVRIPEASLEGRGVRTVSKLISSEPPPVVSILLSQAKMKCAGSAILV